MIAAPIHAARAVVRCPPASARKSSSRIAGATAAAAEDGNAASSANPVLTSATPLLPGMSSGIADVTGSALRAACCGFAAGGSAWGAGAGLAVTRAGTSGLAGSAARDSGTQRSVGLAAEGLTVTAGALTLALPISAAPSALVPASAVPASCVPISGVGVRSTAGGTLLSMVAGATGAAVSSIRSTKALNAASHSPHVT